MTRLHIPFKKWALGGSNAPPLTNATMEEQNLLAIERWARSQPPRTLTWTIPEPDQVAYPGWVAPQAIVFAKVVLNALVAGTTDTDVDLYNDGTLFGSYTLAATETQTVIPVNLGVGDGKVLYPELTAVGTGVENLSVQVVEGG